MKCSPLQAWLESWLHFIKQQGLYFLRPTSSSVGKDLSANAGDVRDVGLIPGSGRSRGGGHGNPLQYSCVENPHGQRSLVGYSPWGCQELDRTEVTYRSILKEISPGISLEGMMLKLKLQYFGHLMRRVDSLED